MLKEVRDFKYLDSLVTCFKSPGWHGQFMHVQPPLIKQSQLDLWWNLLSFYNRTLQTLKPTLHKFLNKRYTRMLCVILDIAK